MQLIKAIQIMQFKSQQSYTKIYQALSETKINCHGKVSDHQNVWEGGYILL